MKYPYIDLSRFKILTHINNDASVHLEVLFIDLSKGASHEVDYKIEDNDKAKFGTMRSLHSTFTRTGRSHLCEVGKGLSIRFPRARCLVKVRICGMTASQERLCLTIH